MRDKLEQYANLLVRVGLNIEVGQTLVINSPIECAEFARMVTVKAYEAGAREVLLRWSDEQSVRLRYKLAHNEVFDETNSWDLDFLNSTVDRGAAYLKIAASDPELMKDVDPKRISRQNKVNSNAMEYYRGKLMSNENVWCVASIPTQAWANKVFPEAESDEKAVELLWEAIFKAVRVDRENPVEAWKEHQKLLSKRKELLNREEFKALRYRNKLGTDVTVELVKNHIWFGGGEESTKGQFFVANMPTEEIFSMPKAHGVNGRVVASLPLNYNGNLIENFAFTFKDGQVTDFTAEKGAEVLEEMLNTDEGARRLGEVALVPYDSPISNQKILFYNTLFDENASCHFALGKAYPINVKGGELMSKEELIAAGANDSLIHVDFMIGTDDLEITGIKADGSEIPLFHKGNFISL